MVQSPNEGDMSIALIYIAGPYTALTHCDIAANVQRAREVADAVARAGAFPVTPHLLGDGIEDAGDEAFWYEGTLEVMRRCDALVTVEGWHRSKGANTEIDAMVALGKPVLYSIGAVRDWVALRKAEAAR